MHSIRYSRREFLNTLGYGAAAAGFSSILMACGGKPQKPNVLFIAIDDLNDWANCLGGRPGVITPNLDRLAKRGVLFTNAHCSAPACNPSRTSLFTGIRPSTSGVYHNSHHWRESPVLKNAVKIPEHFGAHGYNTIGGGKLFHCLSWIRTAYGVDENDFDVWDEYFPSKSRSIPDSLWPGGAMEDEEGTVRWPPLAGRDTEGRPSYFFDWGPLEETDNKMADTKVVDWAVAELARRHDKPLFMGIGIFRPHIPWFVPKKYFDLYPLDSIELPHIVENDLEDCSEVGKGFCRRKWQEWILKNDMWKEAVRAYLASISYADAQLGRLLDALDRGPLARNTIIVLWSDHGMHIGEKEHWEKFTLWEESTRVPLIWVAPGTTNPGSRCDHPVSLLDVYPTLVDLCGLTQLSHLEGQSLRPWLLDTERPKREPAMTTHGRNNHSVRTRRWRYIRYHDGSEELYDHVSDPDEFTNIGDAPQYDSLKDELGAWIPKVNVKPAY